MEQEKKTFRRLSKSAKMNDEFQVNFDLDEILSEEELEASNEIEEDRNYKREYERYHSRPEQIKRRSARNSARRTVKKKTKNEEDIEGKDVHHKDNDPLNNDPKNLSVVTKHYNRREPRLRERKAKELESAFEEVLALGESVVNNKKIRMLIITSKSEDNKSGLMRTAERIVEECEKRKIPVYPFFCEDGIITKEEDGSWTAYNEDDKKGFALDRNNTVAVVRGSVARYKSWLDKISQLEKIGVFCMNFRSSVEACADKYLTSLKLADAAIPTPKTVLLQREGKLKDALEIFDGKFPLIVKTLSGSKGVGVVFVESERALSSTIQLIWKVNEDEELLLQEYIKTDFDVRVIVLGKKILATMRRDVISGDFRSNFSLGGKVKKYKLTEEEEKICLESAKAVDGTFVAVDFIPGKKGTPFVIEVNSSPGTEGIEKATKENIVGQLIDFAEDKSNWSSKAQEAGLLETLEIENIGTIIGKFDTGNNVKCILHADESKVNGNKVEWSVDGHSFKHDLIKMQKFQRGAPEPDIVEKPVIKFNVIFNGTKYEDIEFLLDNRTRKKTKLLINQTFMKLANIMVNPNRKFVITDSHTDLDNKEENPYNLVIKKKDQ